EMGQVELVKAPDAARVLARTNDFLVVAAHGSAGVSLETVAEQADFWRTLVTEAGTELGWPRVHVQGTEALIYLRVPAHLSGVVFEIGSVVCQHRSEADEVLPTLASLLEGNQN